MAAYLWGYDPVNRPPDAERLLRALNVTGKMLGFHYAIYMIEQVREEPDRIHLITKRLYRETAQHYGVTANSVEKAVRNMIGSIWERTDHVVLEHIAGTELSRQPSNSEFIDMLAGYLRNLS